MPEQFFNLSTLNSENGLNITSDEEGDLGYSISEAGDINGDGIDDLIIGAPLTDVDGKIDAGKTYVLFGGRNVFTDNINLSNLSSSQGFIINGANPGDQSGRSVSNLGDINGDSIDDLIIGAPFSGINGEQSGAVYVVYGNNTPNYFSTPIDLSNLDNGNKGFVITGNQADDNAGWSVSSAGDFNGDGVKDLLIGATDPGNNGPGIKGESYVVFGKQDGAFGSTLNLSNLGNQGLKFISNEDNNLGYSVSNAGDINNDGIDDIIIGAPYADPNGNYNAGKSYVVYGSNSFDPNNNTINVSDLNGTNGFTINGQNNDQSGFFVSDAGDFNGDGIDDLIIGARDGNPNGINYAGRTYIVYGKQGGLGANVDLATLDAATGLTINGINDSDNSGWSVSSLGDINNDGKNDIIIGAPNANDGAGQAYVIYGTNDLGQTLNLQDLNGTNGFIINGLVAGDNLGQTVTKVGDINGDGADDLMISTPFANSNNGGAYVIYGTYVNQAPTDLTLAPNAVNENVAAGTSVGIFTSADPNPADTFGYTLVDGEGATDNGSFTIEGNQLKINLSPDFETKSSYSIRVRTTDKGGSAEGLSYEKQLTVIINDLDETEANQAPTDLTLAPNAVNENVTAGTSVGTFTTTDVNSGDTFAYSLVDGEGATDNGSFIIEGNQLKINLSPDFETKSSYNIRVKTTDKGGSAEGLSYEKQLTISINDLDENQGNETNQAPTNLTLDKKSVNENVAVGTLVGTLSTTDPNTGDTFTYSLVQGNDDDDNSSFSIEGNQLKIKVSPDFETKSSYKIRLQTQDAGGLVYQQAFTVNVNNINENSSGFLLTKVGNDVFNIQGNNGKATLEVKLTGRNASNVNELGVFTVDDAAGTIDGIAPGAAGYTEKALLRSQVIFSALRNSPAGFDATQLNRLLGFNSNDDLRFYLVKSGSTESVLNNATPKENVLFPSASNLQISDLGSGKYSLNWEDGTGAADYADFKVIISGTNDGLALGTNLQNKPEGESLDLRGTNQIVKADFTVNREAGLNNTVGFYRVTGEHGGIDTTGDGVADVLPGQAGYIQAAINSRVDGLNLSAANGGTATYSANLQGGSIFVPFLIVSSTVDAFLDSNSANDPQIYFSFLGANSDRVDHIRILGDNTFGFEDIAGGGDRDYNDLVVRVSLQP